MLAKGPYLCEAMSKNISCDKISGVLKAHSCPYETLGKKQTLSTENTRDRIIQVVLFLKGGNKMSIDKPVPKVF